MPRDSSRLSRPTCCFKELPEPRCSNCRKPHWMGAASGHSSKFVDMLDGKTVNIIWHWYWYLWVLHGKFVKLWNYLFAVTWCFINLSIPNLPGYLNHLPPIPRIFSVGATSGGLAVCGTLRFAGRGITSLSADTHEMKIMKYQTSGSGVMMSAPCDNMRQLLGSTCF